MSASDEIPNFRRGDRVQKRKSYRFPGVVATVYECTIGPNKGKTNVVVECTAEGAEGCQHIFAPEQLELMP